MLEVRELRLLRAIAQNGSLVRAARVLGVGQPALTRSLAAIETRLRGPLFERSRQGVIATNLGRAILAEAADILDRMDQLGRTVAAVRGEQVQELRIAAGNYVAESVGNRAAARMLGLYPATRLRLLPGDWASVPQMLHAREATVGLLDLRSHEPDPALEAEPLRPQPGVFVARRDHPLAGRDRLTLADILSFPLIMIGRRPQHTQGPMAAAREAAVRAGVGHAAFPAMIHESPSIAVSVLRHCDAVVPATLGVAGPALRSGEVVALRWREPWVALYPGILRLRGRAPGEAEQAFLDLLHDEDRIIEQETRAWLGELGLPVDCA